VLLVLHHYNNLKTSKDALFWPFSLKRLNQANISAEPLRILAPLRQSEAISEDVGRGIVLEYVEILRQQI
jgi:hypothetical protein